MPADVLPLNAAPVPVSPAVNRLPGFERVRAGAMLLVVAFHAALPYASAELPGLLWAVPVHGEVGRPAGLLADPLFWAAEAVIMPLFFGMSGWFSGSLGSRKSSDEFVAGRVRRVLVPLCVGVVTVVGVSLVIWSVGFPLTERATWREFRRFNFPGPIRDTLWGPAHLWYLEYLFLLAMLQVPLDAVVRAADEGRSRAAARVLRVVDRVGASPWRFLALTGAVGVILAIRPEVYLGFQHGWFPFRGKFLHAGACFLYGWLCWRHRAALASQAKLQRGLLAGSLASAAAVVWFARQVNAEALPAEGLAVPVGWCTGLTVSAALLHGAGSRRPASRLTAWLAGASFWVYLVHQPLVGAAQLGLWFVPIPADAKFLAVLVGVTGVCLAAEPLSRRTRWGRLLTGRAPATEPRAVSVAEPLRPAA